MEKECEDKCPECNSDNLNFDTFDLIDGDCWKQNVTCGCGCCFIQHYTMVYDFTEYEAERGD